jgi:hypothetical protein
MLEHKLNEIRWLKLTDANNGEIYQIFNLSEGMVYRYMDKIAKLSFKEEVRKGKDTAVTSS